MRCSALTCLFALALAVGCDETKPAVADAAADAAPPPADAAPDASSTPPDGIPAAVAAHPLSSPAARLMGLDGPVDVVYDRMGWPHIYASSLRDAATVQGVAMARDRLPQMEMLRRVASGTLAERFGVLSGALVGQDLTARVLGLRRAAEAMWAATPPGRARTMLEGFSRGVNLHLQAVARGDATLPPGTNLVIDESTPEWTPVDSLVIGRYQSYALSYDAEDDINLSALVERLTTVFERAGSPRRGILADVLRWTPPAQVAVVPDFFPRPTGMRSTFRPDVEAPAIGPLLGPAQGFLQHTRALAELWGDETRGSNNWLVHPSASTTGRALLANDPHLSLTGPAIWWGSQLTVTRGPDAVDVTGTTFPGIPGVIIGFTPRLAWGVTTAGYDVTDVYVETITPGTNGMPDTVRFNGREVPIEIRTEAVATGTGTYMARYEYVPHHGPIVPEIRNNQIVPRTGNRALSIRWTGHQPTTELDAFLGVAYARSAAEAKQAVRAFGVGAQNWVIADIDGNAEYTSHANIPVRAAGALTWSPMALNGTHPCAVLPGTGEAEWTGNLAPERIPQATLSSARPWIETANQDQAGVTFDGNPFNDPAYLGCAFDRGWRGERIAERLRALENRVGVDDLKAIQADVQILAAGRLRPFLAQAMARLELEWTTPNSQRDLTALANELRPRRDRLRDAARRVMAWSLRGESGVEAGATDAQRGDAVATSIFHAWLGQVSAAALNDEFAALNMGQPTSVGTDRIRLILRLLEDASGLQTRDMATGQSTLWDDLSTADAAETRDLILARALDRALTALASAAVFNADDPNLWRWGAVHTVRFGSIIPGPGAVLSIPRDGDPMFPRGFPRPGGIDVVDASHPGLGTTSFSFGSGPSQRFVIELDPAGPRAFNAIPGGQSADNTSPHFRDGAELWRQNQYHEVPRAEPAVVAAATQHLRFLAP